MGRRRNRLRLLATSVALVSAGCVDLFGSSDAGNGPADTSDDERPVITVDVRLTVFVAHTSGTAAQRVPIYFEAGRYLPALDEYDVNQLYGISTQTSNLGLANLRHSFRMNHADDAIDVAYSMTQPNPLTRGAADAEISRLSYSEAELRTTTGTYTWEILTSHYVP